VAYFCNLKNTQSKQSPKEGRKFAESGHPGQQRARFLSIILVPGKKRNRGTQSVWKQTFSGKNNAKHFFPKRFTFLRNGHQGCQIFLGPNIPNWEKYNK
jgi:hypothetical protein